MASSITWDERGIVNASSTDAKSQWKAELETGRRYHAKSSRKAPTISALEEHVSSAVGSPVNLQSLDPTHSGGFSGAISFLAHANDEFAYGETSLASNDSSKGRVVAVIKLFVHGLDNGITEELSSLEWLLLQTNGDIKTAAPLAVGRMTWDTKPAGVVTYQVAPGIFLYQLMMQMGKQLHVP
ncbi:hypothetical protein VN97_g3228 [Penicillium thymicola]|uniref:Uncharacterized protein n=1 Tax=Penicillium thymicola TaxID=293382 RepID=A0AAI9TP13_PENTH|nr:hypothetical protein VN97_g3228 [Penicillium thymicola]